MTAVDPDVLGRAEIAAMDALIASGLGRQVRGDGNTMAAVVSAVIAAAAPVLTQPPASAAEHGAEAYRVGYDETLQFGWQCLRCGIDVLVPLAGRPDAARDAAERSAAAHNASFADPGSQDEVQAAALAAVQRAGTWCAALAKLADHGPFSKWDIAFDVVGAVQPLITAQNAATVAGMCHWVQGVGDARAETHREFHFGFTCPYEAAAAVLRGQPDPRGTHRDQTGGGRTGMSAAPGMPGSTSDSGASNGVAKPEPGAEGTG